MALIRATGVQGVAQMAPLIRGWLRGGDLVLWAGSQWRGTRAPNETDLKYWLWLRRGRIIPVPAGGGMDAHGATYGAAINSLERVGEIRRAVERAANVWEHRSRSGDTGSVVSRSGRTHASAPRSSASGSPPASHRVGRRGVSSPVATPRTGAASAGADGDSVTTAPERSVPVVPMAAAAVAWWMLR